MRHPAPIRITATESVTGKPTQRRDDMDWTGDWRGIERQVSPNNPLATLLADTLSAIRDVAHRNREAFAFRVGIFVFDVRQA